MIKWTRTSSLSIKSLSHCPGWQGVAGHCHCDRHSDRAQGERERGREGGRERGREAGREGGREAGREGDRERGRQGGRE